MSSSPYDYLLSKLESQSSLLRNTLFEHIDPIIRFQLLNNDPNSTKPEQLLSIFNLAEKQLQQVNNSSDTLLEYFCFRPLRPGKNYNDVPLLLSSRLEPEIKEHILDDNNGNNEIKEDDNDDIHIGKDKDDILNEYNDKIESIRENWEELMKNSLENMKIKK